MGTQRKRGMFLHDFTPQIFAVVEYILLLLMLLDLRKFVKLKKSLENAKEFRN